jgi:hypothetical protein
MTSHLKLLVVDPPIDWRAAEIPKDLLDRPLPGKVLYEAARHAYASQEESIRSLQNRAAQLLVAGLIVAVGVVWCYVNTDVLCRPLALATITVLALGLASLIWAIKPVPYLAAFSAEELATPPDNGASEDQLLLWAALGYQPLIRSATNASKAIAYRLAVACSLLVLSVALLTIAFACGH